MTDGTEILREEIRKVGSKVDALQSSADSDRKFLQSLHADHLRLEGRVKSSEERIQKTQADLDKHIDVACVIQEATRKDVTETKEMLRAHVAQEDIDRREIMKHLRETAQRAKESGATMVMWAIGIGVSVVATLFGLLWVTGTVGT
jgi:hypothetical protein